MNLSKYFSLFVVLFLSLRLSGKDNPKEFVLVSEEVQKKIYLDGETDISIRLAVKDLVHDLKRVCGKDFQVVDDFKKCGDGCIVIGIYNDIFASGVLKDRNGDFAFLKHKWESYLVKIQNKNLGIIGSDTRGTIFAVYDFIEKYLGIDPMYFWSDIMPEKKTVLSWNEVFIQQGEPTFKYRGWFINDEDLLSEWMTFSGKRYIDYPYYDQVVNPQIMEKVVETILRLRMNLIIPASFVDIMNPPERTLVEIASKRGLFISMHHIEPLGVSGFSFQNYWMKKNKKKETFSYYSNKDKILETWNIYAENWMKFKNIIWQVGLRGFGDRPMWQADPGVPQDDMSRGKIISDGIKSQVDIINKVDDRTVPLITTTLWMEGSPLYNKGYLVIPDNVITIFSDNSPGWTWPPAFYDINRTTAKHYGVYYHVQLWGTGPHLAQAVPLQHIYNMIKEPYLKGDTTYAILNVSNIRPFLLPEAGLAEMLFDFKKFELSNFNERWMKKRFGDPHYKEVEKVYDDYFSGFSLPDKTLQPSIRSNGIQDSGPLFLDGRIKSYAGAVIKNIRKGISEERSFENIEGPNFLTDDFLESLNLQYQKHIRALESANEVITQLAPESKFFFETNMVSHIKIMLGMEQWLIQLCKSYYSLKENKPEMIEKNLTAAIKSFDTVREGQVLTTKGEKWENWYNGDKKVNLLKCENDTRELLKLLIELKK